MLVSSLLFTARPVVVVVPAMRWMMTSWLISGLPRQFWLIRDHRDQNELTRLLSGGVQQVRVVPRAVAFPQLAKGVS